MSQNTRTVVKGADGPCRGAKKIRGADDAESKAESFLDDETLKDFFEMMQHIRSTDPGRFGKLQTDLDGMVDGDIGTAICSFEQDRLKESLDGLDLEPKGLVMDYLVDNEYMTFDIQ